MTALSREDVKSDLQRQAPREIGRKRELCASRAARHSLSVCARRVVASECDAFFALRVGSRKSALSSVAPEVSSVAPEVSVFGPARLPLPLPPVRLWAGPCTGLPIITQCRLCGSRPTCQIVAEVRDLVHRGYEFKREHAARFARSFGNPRSTNLLNLIHRARTPTQPKASLHARSAKSWD